MQGAKKAEDPEIEKRLDELLACRKKLDENQQLNLLNNQRVVELELEVEQLNEEKAKFSGNECQSNEEIKRLMDKNASLNKENDLLKRERATKASAARTAMRQLEARKIAMARFAGQSPALPQPTALPSPDCFTSPSAAVRTLPNVSRQTSPGSAGSVAPGIRRVQSGGIRPRLSDVQPPTTIRC